MRSVGGGGWRWTRGRWWLGGGLEVYTWCWVGRGLEVDTGCWWLVGIQCMLVGQADTDIGGLGDGEMWCGGGNE